MQINLAIQEVFHVLLVFCRLGGFFMLAPGLGSDMIPSRVRLFLALAFSVAISISLSSYLPPLPATLFGLSFLIVVEVLIGIALGSLVQIILSSLHTAGTIIAYQTGMGVAQIANPSLGELSGVFAAFLTLVGMVVVFVSGAEQMLIMALINTYKLFPPGFDFSGENINDFIQMSTRIFAGSFSIGLQLAIPFVIYGFAFYASIGILAKLIPQIQVFFLSLPLSIFLGLGLLAFLMSPLMNAYLSYFGESLSPLFTGQGIAVN